MTDREVPVEITVHEFAISKWYDADMAAASALYTWEQSAAGQWITARAISIPAWYRLGFEDGHNVFEVRVLVMPRVATEYLLRWGQSSTRIA